MEQKTNIIIYSNSFTFENVLLAFRKKQLFDITNIPKLVQFNENANCWIVKRKQLTLKKVKELVTNKEIEKDVSCLQWYEQLHLDYVFNLKKKNMKKTITLLAILLLISCAPRKMKKSEETEKAKKEVATETSQTETTTKSVDNNTTTKKDVVIDSKKNEVTEVEIIEADDKSKPAYYNGRELGNTKITKSKTNVLSKEKKVDNTIIENKIKALETENKQYLQTIKELEQVARNKSDKETKKSEPYILYISIGLFLLLLIYIVWKRYVEPLAKKLNN